MQSNFYSLELKGKLQPIKGVDGHKVESLYFIILKYRKLRIKCKSTIFQGRDEKLSWYKPECLVTLQNIDRGNIKNNYKKEWGSLETLPTPNISGDLEDCRC